MLVVSDVLTIVWPSGLTAMPSGSTPVGICAITLRAGTSITVTMLSSSFDTKSGLPETCRAKVSGSGPDGRSPMMRSVFGSMTWIVSSSLAQTRIWLPSAVIVMPRGRWPTGTVFTVVI